MAIRINITTKSGEMSVEADTPSEAAAFVADYAAKASASPAVKHPSPPKPEATTGGSGDQANRPPPQLRLSAHGRAWTDSDIRQYVASLSANPLAFLSALVLHGTLDADAIADAIGVRVNVVGPIVRSLTRHAERLGYIPPFDTEVLVPNGKRYQMDHVFRQAAAPIIAAIRKAA